MIKNHQRESVWARLERVLGAKYGDIREGDV